MAGTRRIVDAIHGDKTTDTRGAEWQRGLYGDPMEVALSRVAAILCGMGPQDIERMVDHMVDVGTQPDVDTLPEVLAIMGQMTALLIDAQDAIRLQVATEPSDDEALDSEPEVSLDSRQIGDGLAEDEVDEAAPETIIVPQAISVPAPITEPREPEDSRGEESGKELQADDVLVDEIDGQKYGTTAQELDEIDDEEVAISKIRELMVGLGAADGELDPARLQVLLDQIREKRLTVLDIGDAFIEDMVRKYIGHTRSSMSAKIVNSVCFWAYLRGEEVETLVYARSITKPDANKPDVHNGRRAVVDGYLKSRRDAAFDKAEEEQAKIRREFTAIIEDGFSSADPENEPTVETPTVETPSETTVVVERPIEEEPIHVQLANRVIETLELPGELLAAAVALLDPNSKGAISDNKETILKALRMKAVLKDRAGKTAIDLLTSQVSPPSIARVREFLGAFTRSGKPDERAFRSIGELVEKRTPLDRERMTADFNNGLAALLDVIQDRKLAEHNPKVIKQVVFGDDGAPTLK